MIAISSYDSRSGSQFLKTPANDETKPSEPVISPPTEPASAPDPFLELLAYGDDDSGVYEVDIWRSNAKGGDASIEEALARAARDKGVPSGETKVYDVISDGRLLARIFPDGQTVLVPPHEAALQQSAGAKASDAEATDSVPDRIARLRTYFEHLSIPIRVVERTVTVEEPLPETSPLLTLEAIGKSSVAPQEKAAAAEPQQPAPQDENMRFLLELLGETPA